MAHNSTRQLVKRAAKEAIAAQDKVSGEVDCIIEEYNKAYYHKENTKPMRTDIIIEQDRQARHENEQYLVTCLEYSFLLRDMLIRLQERL